MKGSLADMTVADLLQVTCENRKQGMLTIKHANDQAQVYFTGGNIVHASLEGQEGKEVIFRILNWDKGTFNFKAGRKPDKITIALTWQALLLEGAKFLDEGAFEAERADLARTDLKKENAMNIKRINQVVEDLKEDLGAGLVATDTWVTRDAQSLAGFNSQPKAIALFNEITRSIDKTLKGASVPGLGSYYMINLDNNMMVVVLQCGEVQQGMLVDLSKTTLGMLTSVALPRVISGLEEATH